MGAIIFTLLPKFPSKFSDAKKEKVSNLCEDFQKRLITLAYDEKMEKFFCLNQISFVGLTPKFAL